MIIIKLIAILGVLLISRAMLEFKAALINKSNTPLSVTLRAIVGIVLLIIAIILA